jgi:DNA polymerase-3 subunit delta
VLIEQRDAERVLAAPDGLVAVLLFGPDAGLVRERAEAVVRRQAGSLNDPFRVAELAPPRWPTLSDELASASLTGGGRVVRIRDATDAAAPALAEALKRGLRGGLAVLEAGDLAPRSKLRSLAQQADAVAAIGCYAEEPKALERRLRDALAEGGLTADAEALGLIAERLPADRGVVRQEIEKLILLAGPQGHVTAELALLSVAALADDAADAAIEVALAGDAAGADGLLEQVMSGGAAGVAILRAAIRQAVRLHAMRGAVVGGQLASAIVQNWRPPIHFRSRPPVLRALGLWTESGLTYLIAKLVQAEQDMKSGRPEHALCRPVVHGMARPV